MKLKLFTLGFFLFSIGVFAINLENLSAQCVDGDVDIEIETATEATLVDYEKLKKEIGLNEKGLMDTSDWVSSTFEVEGGLLKVLFPKTPEIVTVCGLTSLKATDDEGMTFVLTSQSLSDAADFNIVKQFDFLEKNIEKSRSRRIAYRTKATDTFGRIGMIDDKNQLFEQLAVMKCSNFIFFFETSSPLTLKDGECVPLKDSSKATTFIKSSVFTAH